MANVSITFCRTSNIKGVSAIAEPVDAVSENLVSSASSAQSTNSASNLHQVVRVTASGNDVWVAIGSNPTAAQGNTFLITNGSTEYFAIEVGSKVAVIDA